MSNEIKEMSITKGQRRQYGFSCLSIVCLEEEKREEKKKERKKKLNECINNLIDQLKKKIKTTTKMIICFLPSCQYVVNEVA